MINVCVQTTLLLIFGLTLCFFLRRCGPAVVALIQRATLAALAISVLVSLCFAARLPALWRVPLPTSSSAPPPPVPISTARVLSEDAPLTPSMSKTFRPMPEIPLPAEETKTRKAAHAWTTVEIVWAIWAAGALAGMMRLTGAHMVLRRLRRQGQIAMDATLTELAGRMDVDAPKLVSHASVQSPFLVGVRQPLLYLPETWEREFDDTTRRAIFVHELTHLQRRDPAWNVFSQLLSALLWPQVLLIVLRRQMARTSEELCDLAVLEFSHCPPRRYADCLLRLAERGNAPSFAVGIVPFRSTLARRIALILSKENRPVKPVTARLRLLAALGAACLVGVSLCLISVGNAQTPPNPTGALAAQERDNQTAALENAKQIGLALAIYAQDNNEKFPPASRWMDAIARYQKRVDIYRDPSAPNQKYAFAFNRALSGKTLIQLDNPATTVAVFASTLNRQNASDSGESLPRPGWHSGGSIYVFTDGHAKYFRDAVRPLLAVKFLPAPKTKKVARAMTPSEKSRYVADVYTHNSEWVKKYDRLARAQTGLERAEAELEQARAELARSRQTPSNPDATNLTLNFLSGELADHKIKMLQAENKLAGYKRRQSRNSPESLSNDTAQLRNLKGQLENMRITMADAALRQGVFVQQLERMKLSGQISGISNFDKAINNLKVQKQILLSNGKTVTHPMVKVLAAQIADMERNRKRISQIQSATPASKPKYQALKMQLQEAKISQITMNKQMQALQTEIAAYKARIRMAQSQPQLAELQRSYSLYKAQYENLLRQREEFMLKQKLKEKTGGKATP